jgi:hypothetical protein
MQVPPLWQLQVPVRPARPTAAPRVRGCWLVLQTRQWRQSWIRVEPPPSPPSPPWAGPAGGSVGEAAVHSCWFKLARKFQSWRASCARRAHVDIAMATTLLGGVVAYVDGPKDRAGHVEATLLSVGAEVHVRALAQYAGRTLNGAGAVARRASRWRRM